MRKPRPQAVAERFPREAVGWMLGPELIHTLRTILRRRRDPRRWMAYFDGCAHDERKGAGAIRDAEGRAPGAERVREGPPNPFAARPPTEPPFWFDYVADLGDASASMYAIAYALQADLTESKGAIARWTPKSSGAPTLPRGAFLFVGGDSAYHVADAPTVRARVQEPFEWAWDDLAATGPAPDKRRIYGIPGNHDWYDDLGGFSLLFRRGTKPRAHVKGWREPIELRGFARVQLGSYVALRLPHDWELWGLDIDGGLDAHQCAYFESLMPGRKQQPPRLVLCTPSPPLAFGAVTAPEHHDRALRSLRLARPYGGPHPSSLPDGCVRLDLSGDVHHYARYQDEDEDPAYAAVVSGLGGAFHHPTFTVAGDVPRAKEWPEPEVSREAVAPELLHPKSLVVGSWVRALPFLFALLLGFASINTGAAGALSTRLLASVPGMPHVPPAGDVNQLTKILLLLAVLLCSGGLAWAAVELFRQTHHAHTLNPSMKLDFWEALTRKPLALLRPSRSYWASSLLGATALLALVLFPFCPYAPRALTAASDLATLLLGTGGLIGGAIAGWAVGGKHLPPARRIPIALAGLVLGSLVVLTPLLCARAAKATAFSIAHFAAAVVGTWALLAASRLVFRWRSALGLAVIWLGAAGAGLWAVLRGAGGELSAPGEPVLWAALRFLGGGLAAAFLSTSYFTWYLAIAALLGGHNNEVGGAARVTKFRQFIRFRVDAEGLHGHVIAVEDEGACPLKGEGRLVFRVIDRFRLARPGP